MLVSIVVTIIVTVLTLIVSVTLYLLSLLSEGTDDPNAPDALAFDPRECIVSPNVSPVCDLPACDNQGQCRHEAPLELVKSNGTTLVQLTEDQPEKLVPASKEILPPDPATSIASDERLANSISDSTSASLPEPSPNVQVAEQRSGQPGKLITDEYDLKEMRLGGNGLHWCRTKKALIKLIQLGFDKNELNKRHESPLHSAIRRRNLQLVIGLLSHGAELESLNDRGETPLMLACRLNDVYSSQLLMVFDANVDCADRNGVTARHYVASSCDKARVVDQTLPSRAHLILAMLDELGARRCQAPPETRAPAQAASNQSNQLTDESRKPAKGRGKCTPGCSHSGSYNGNRFGRWLDYSTESSYKRHMFMDILDRRIKSSPTDSAERRRCRLLTIDGGGMRGVIVCQIMIEIEKYLKRPMISYFDWVGGTSVGAFLACALCNGISLAELRRSCFDVKDEVFCGAKPYNSKFLEKVLKQVCGERTRLSDIKGRKLAVTTVLADRDPCQLRIFRNYKSPAELLEERGYPARFYDSVTSQAMITRVEKPGLAASGGAKSGLKSAAKAAPAARRKSSNEKLSLGPSGIAKPAARAGTATLAASKETYLEQVLVEGEKDPLLWQAVRASAAAPFFFKPYGPYLDGGIISNNPLLDMLSEFYAHKQVRAFLRARQRADERAKHQLEESEEELELVVSLGTGRGRTVGQQAMVNFGNIASGLATVFSPVELLRSIRAARDLFKKLVHRSCMTDDHILDRAQAWCSSMNVPYFRMNPPLASIFSIDDKRDEQLINALWQTKLYMRALAPQLKQLGQLLDRS